MTILKLAELYVSSRIVSEQYGQQIIRTAKRFQTATGPIELEAIGAEQMARFVRWLTSFTGSPNTKANHLCHLTLLFRYAVRSGLLEKEPQVPKIKRVKRIPRAWGLEDFRRLYEIANCLPGRVGVHLARLWWSSLIATAYHSGSRIGALLNVRWSDIDLDRGWLVIRPENTKTQTEQVFLLPQYVVTKIAELRWPKRELIWEWPHCRRYFFSYFRKKIARPAKLEPIAGERFGLFHKIRRTAASLAAAQAGIAAAQTLLGHTSAKVTVEHYIYPRLVAGGSVTLPSLE